MNSTKFTDPNYKKTRKDTIEYYWQDFLQWCTNSSLRTPTENCFWEWYIGPEGPLGLHKVGRYYTLTVENN